MSDVEDMEHITPGDIPPPTVPTTRGHMSSEERLYRSDYAQVLFHNIAEAYQTGADIECCYTITSLLEPMPRDWVGIYKVGWSSVRDYVCFNWSPVPVDYQQMKDARNRLTFQASCVPREDGEFYQFCYVTAKGLVRGASTPFQFRQPGTDDYVEVEDMEDDIMVVKTRTSALEDDLKQVLVAKEKLIERSRMLELERDGLLGKLVEYDNKMGSVKKERDMLAKIVEDCRGKLDGVRTTNEELEEKHSNVLDELKKLTSERDAVVCKLADKEGEMRLLQDRVVMLTKDNDIATGTNQTLVEQKELFEHHFTTSESRLVAYQRERDDRKKQITVLEGMCASQREDLIRFKTDAEKLKSTLDRQQSNGRSDLAKIDALTEQLRNAEDKLCAAEHCKKLLNDEMAVLDQAQQKASSRLEESRSEVHMLRGQLTKMEAQQIRDNEMISDEVSKCQLMLQEENKEKERLAELLQQSNEQMREFVIDRLPEKEAALQILQDAQRDLKKQFSRLEGRASDMHRRLERMHQEKSEWQLRESQLTQEIDDLKERLLMGQDEYKMQFVECAQAKRQLSKLHKSAATRVSDSPEHSTSSKCEKEVQVTSNGDYVETNVDDNCSQTDADSVKMADLSSPEIQEQLAELGRELDARNEKKNRYKNLFYEERRKNALLQQHYFDQLQKKDEESRRMLEAINLQLRDRVCLNKTVGAPKMDLPKTDEARPQLHPGKATAGAVVSDYPDEMDPLRNIPHGLTTPMTPLPPPISPEVLPSAKVAAVKAAVLNKAAVIPTLLDVFDGADTGVEDCGRCSDHGDHGDHGDQTAITTEDASYTTSEKTCPVCNGIMGDLTEHQMMEHVNSHYSQECPMCNHVFPQDYDKDAFRQHVERHFTEDI